MLRFLVLCELWLGCMIDQVVPSKELIIRRLRHSEQLLPTAVAHYRFEVVPSPPSDIERVRQVLKSRNNHSDPRLHCAGEKVVQSLSHSMIWKRKNEKELFEKSRKHSETGQPIKDVKAFDGAVVRAIKFGSGAPLAVLKKPDLPDEWHMQPEWSPFYLVYRRHSEPWSSVIERTKDVEVTNDKIGDIAVIRVSIPTEGDQIIRRDHLFYDQDFRLVRRDRYGFPPHAETAVRLMGREDFRDYRSHLHPSGETVRYPHETLIQYVFGICADGEPAVWCRAVVRVDHLDIAPEIPDSDFVPELPPNAIVKDELVTNANIPSERQQVAWQASTKTGDSSWWTRLAILGGAFIMVSIAVVWYRHRIRRRT
jgi:hypothetical protein